MIQFTPGSRQSLSECGIPQSIDSNDKNSFYLIFMLSVVEVDLNDSHLFSAKLSESGASYQSLVMVEHHNVRVPRMINKTFI